MFWQTYFQADQGAAATTISTLAGTSPTVQTVVVKLGGTGFGVHASFQVAVGVVEVAGDELAAGLDLLADFVGAVEAVEYRRRVESTRVGLNNDVLGVAVIKDALVRESVGSIAATVMVRGRLSRSNVVVVSRPRVTSVCFSTLPAAS